jgi:hypothetical protein
MLTYAANRIALVCIACVASACSPLAGGPRSGGFGKWRCPHSVRAGIRLAASKKGMHTEVMGFIGEYHCCCYWSVPLPAQLPSGCYRQAWPAAAAAVTYWPIRSPKLRRHLAVFIRQVLFTLLTVPTAAHGSGAEPSLSLEDVPMAATDPVPYLANRGRSPGRLPVEKCVAYIRHTCREYLLRA